jgi:hypothetical protein
MSNENTPSKFRSVSTLAIACFFFGFLIIAFTALQWDLIELFTPFLIAPMILCFQAGFVGLTLATIIYLAVQFRENLAKAILPLLINGATFLILWLVPFTDIRLDLEFRSNYQAYNEIIEMVEDGRIESNDIGLAQLPSGYLHISRGGKIIVDQSGGVTSVYFFTFRGVLDNFSGYMYRSNDTPPPHHFIGGDWKQIERKQPQWFFCASW